MPQGYEIEFSLHSDFSTKDADAFVQGTSPSSPSFTPDNHNGSEGLVGGTLYWRVRAVGPYGPGLWLPVIRPLTLVFLIPLMARRLAV
jgi:hypothetical protein